MSRVAAGEVIGAEILVAGAVGQDVLGGGQDRRCDSDDGFLRAAPSLEPQKLRLEVAVLLAGCCSSALHEHRLKPRSPLSDTGRTALSGTLVQTRDEARPR